MTDRARLSKLDSYTKNDGASFLGSQDFPTALVKSVETADPKGLLFSTSEISISPSEAEQRRLKTILDSRIKGNSILVCSGGADKLVPYRCSEAFLMFLKNAVGSWYKDGEFYVEDIIYEGVGHKFTEEMLKDAVRFVNNAVARSSQLSHSISKIQLLACILVNAKQISYRLSLFKYLCPLIFVINAYDQGHPFDLENCLKLIRNNHLGSEAHLIIFNTSNVASNTVYNNTTEKALA